MITTLQTKLEVIYDSIIQAKDIVYLNVNSVSYNGEEYIANIQYIIKHEATEDTGYYETVVYTTTSVFSREQADWLHSMFSITGSTFSEEYENLITKVSLYWVGQTGVFWLTGEDWEIFIPNMEGDE